MTNWLSVALESSRGWCIFFIFFHQNEYCLFRRCQSLLLIQMNPISCFQVKIPKDSNETDSPRSHTAVEFLFYSALHLLVQFLASYALFSFFFCLESGFGGACKLTAATMLHSFLWQASEDSYRRWTEQKTEVPYSPHFFYLVVWEGSLPTFSRTKTNPNSILACLKALRDMALCLGAVLVMGLVSWVDSLSRDIFSR